MVHRTASSPALSTLVLMVLLMERPAEAYVDPGSASYVFQVIAGLLLGGVFLLRTWWDRVVTTVRGLVSRDATRGQ